MKNPMDCSADCRILFMYENCLNPVDNKEVLEQSTAESVTLISQQEAAMNPPAI